MKQEYRLIKDLPDRKAGAIAVLYDGNTNRLKPGQVIPEIGFYWDGEFKESHKTFQCDLYPEWFEPIDIWPKRWDDLNVGFWDFATEKHKKSSLAFAKLSQLAKAMNGDWVPDWTNDEKKWYIIASGDDSMQREYSCSVIGCNICFKSKEAVDFSLKHHHQLWKDYFMLK